MKLILKNHYTVCPTQWTGTNDVGQEVYVKYRGGDLRLDIENTTVLTMTIGDEWDGSLSNLELAKFLSSYEIEFLNDERPEEEYDGDAIFRWLETKRAKNSGGIKMIKKYKVYHNDVDVGETFDSRQAARDYVDKEASHDVCSEVNNGISEKEYEEKFKNTKKKYTICIVNMP